MHKKKLKASIITVCKNSEKDIENTIKSVISQNYKEIEYLIVDGKSTDATMKIINKYKQKIASITSEKDSGIYEAMNKGIKKSTGEIIMFLNAGDSYYAKNTISTIVDVFKKNDIDLLYGDLIIDMGSNKKVKQIFPKVNRKFLYKGYIPHPSTACKKRVFNNYGGFNESFKIASDYEWSLRLFSGKKIKAYYLPIPIAVFNLEGISGLKQYENLRHSERKKVIEKYFSLPQRCILELLFFKKRVERKIKKILTA